MILTKLLQNFIRENLTQTMVSANQIISEIKCTYIHSYGHLLRLV